MQAEVEGAYTPQSRTKRPRHHGTSQGLYAWLAWVFLHRKDETFAHAGGGMAAQEIAHVHLEAMEEAKDESESLV